MQKYDNDFFYKDGVFQQDKAFQAYYEMFAEMGYSLADSLRTNKDFWVNDFGLGDFAQFCPIVGSWCTHNITI